MAVVLTCELHELPEMQGMLQGLMLANVAQMQRARFPRLYESGVRYKREPMGQERWKSAAQVLANRCGDCEDLAAFRAAELRVTGEDRGAVPALKRIRPGLIHCVVLRSDGRVEDPSRLLGMNGKG